MTVGAGAVVGGAVGARVAGTDGAEGVGVCAPGVADRFGDAVGAGAAGGRVEPIVPVPSGDAAGVLGDSVGACRLPASRVALNPARAKPTASEGPSRTYKVKEARPRWP